MSQPGAKPGVLAAPGPARHADFLAFADADLGLVRLRSHVNPASDVPKWRDVGAARFVLQLLSPSPARHPTSAKLFVDSFAQDIEAYLTQGVHDIEVHDEPNRRARGLGVSWRDGAAFGRWFVEVYNLLKSRFGDAIRVGFPALAPSDSPHPDPVVSMAEAAFLAQCRHALEAADWAALHVYWRTSEEMRDLDGGMRCLGRYLEPYPDQRFIVTAFANVQVALAPEIRGQQYVEYVTLMAQYDRLLGVAGLPLRSSDPHDSSLAWITEDGRPTGIITALGTRPRLPDPQRLSLSWPTEIHRYIQIFGANQATYYRRYRMTGGHNGVDLAVKPAGPEKAPIVAALAGTVVQVAFDDEGYGYHVRVRSYGSDGEALILLYGHLSAIEVSVGTLVDRGDLLGWASDTGDDAEPHLHLGMRVVGIRLPQVYDGLNPRPYLGAAPDDST